MRVELTVPNLRQTREVRGRRRQTKTGQTIEGTRTVSDRKIDMKTVVANVHKTVCGGLVPHLFPERLML